MTPSKHEGTELTRRVYVLATPNSLPDFPINHVMINTFQGDIDLWYNFMLSHHSIICQPRNLKSNARGSNPMLNSYDTMRYHNIYSKFVRP